MDPTKNVGCAKGCLLSESLKVGGAIAPTAPPVPAPLHTNFIEKHRVHEKKKLILDIFIKVIGLQFD